MKNDHDQEMKFEAALGELEAIVAAMENGDLPLEEMMRQFERGMNLSKLCAAKLAETEKRIEILVKKANGQSEWREIEETLPGLADG